MEFEQDFFKLMNNSVFGKTMENIRNHKVMKLETHEQNQKYVMKPDFNKPIYLGQAILDLSKTLMYDFHYEYMKPKYCSKFKLCYVDTDSFICETETEDFYRDIVKDVRKGLIRVDIQRMIIDHYPSEKMKK